MDSNRGAQNAGNHAGAHLADTSSPSTSKGQAASPNAASTAPRHAVFDQMAQNYSESQAATSWAGNRYRKQDKSTPQGQKGDIRDSVTESGATTDYASLYSYHSARDLSAFIKEFHGRIFNNQSELYVMPSDDAEFQRLDKQHYAFLLGMGDLFPCADIVHEILSKRAGERRPQILDLGCGSGIWAIEMAVQFPNCDVIGLDLAPPPVDLGTLPPNLRFEIDDINLGLSHFHRDQYQFSVIHVRCVGAGIAGHAKMMRDVEACLKPGGIVFFIDGDQTVYLEDMVTPVAMGQERDEGGDPDEGSWLHRIMREMRDAAVYNGCDVDGLENCIDEGLWGHELIDPATVRVATLCTPVGTWARARDADTQQRLNYIGSLIRQDVMGAIPGWHPMLKKYGIPQETLNKWSERIDAELRDEKFRVCMRWRFTWGRRRLDDASDDIPIAATGGDHLLSAVDSVAPAPVATVIPARNSTGFKFMDVCHTKEEAAAIMAVRRMKVRDLPKTTVVRMRRPSD